MKGKLDPEERVMDDSIITTGGWLGQLSLAVEKVFDRNDELEVVIGGSQVYEIEGDGSKWKPQKGTVKYNNDAFIVIRRPRTVESSLPMVDFTPEHDPYEWDTADHPQ